jgi:predicted TPR repeat methyltransferase
MKAPVLVPMPHSSGDLIADRRYEFAASYAEDGDFAAAAEILEQVVERVESWPVAWNALAKAREALGETAAAVAAYTKAAALDPNDELGASLNLARLSATAPPDAAPEHYVRSLFDQYANRFDAHLTQHLAYRAPQLLADAIARCAPGHFARVVDLGCGTGLCGALFRERAETLIGVDLSPQMIAEARRKNIYDMLHAESITRFLESTPAASVDLMLAADVLAYIGTLDPLFRLVHRALRANGFFAFTVQSALSETSDAASFRIAGDLRYSHDPAYVEAAAQRNGFAIRLLERATPRREAGIDVSGLVVLLQKVESAD